MKERTGTIGPAKPGLVELPIARATIFSDHAGEYKQRIEKKQTGLLKKLSFLKSFLQPDEKILYITTGCSPMSAFERLWTGWIIYYLKQSLIVFTGKRIFHIPTTARLMYKHSIAQILYGDCESINISWGALVVKYKNGKTERFNNIPGPDRRKLKAVIETIPQTGHPSSMPGRAHLCPRCTKELTPGRYECPHCHLLFKDRAEALKISIIYPGGGYFYTGHMFLGISDAATEFMLMVLVIWSLIALIQGETDAVIRLVVFVIMLALEKIYSIYQGQWGQILKFKILFIPHIYF